MCRGQWLLRLALLGLLMLLLLAGQAGHHGRQHHSFMQLEAPVAHSFSVLFRRFPSINLFSCDRPESIQYPPQRPSQRDLPLSQAFTINSVARLSRKPEASAKAY